ncbi:MAG: DNA-binding protein [Candidatus Hadarchaeaceae archaeon]
MKRVAILVLLLLLLAPPTRAETLKDLIDDPVAFDGKQVTFRGEVIGVMVRGDYAWVNIFDNGLAVGVWCRAEDAGLISLVGDYTHRGDIVEGFGIYHMACLEHGGDTDIHAVSLRVVDKGYQIERPLNMPLLLISVTITVAAVILSYYLWHIRKEMRKRAPWPFY